MVFCRLLLLVSQERERSVSLPLTDPDPYSSASKAAVQLLLRTVQLPLRQVSPNSEQHPPAERLRSFRISNLGAGAAVSGRNRRTSTSSGHPGSSAQRRLPSESGTRMETWDTAITSSPRIERGGWAGVVQEISSIKRGSALGVVVIGLFPCPLYVYLRLTDFCRSPDIVNYEDHCWSIGE